VLPTLPSLTGPVGLLHASTAEVGPLHQLRVGLHGEYFGANSFLIAGDANRRLAGGLVAGYTLRRDVELFGAILNSSNRNQRVRDVAVDRDPELIKTFGDLILGGKWVLPLSPAASFGVELGLKFLSGVSDLAVSPSSTSWWLGPLFTYDLRRARDIPMRVHVGANFYADNSSNLRALSGVSLDTKEAAMFAYGIAPSRLRFALAVDAPLEKVFPRVPLVAFLEYHVSYVTADADRDFQDYMTPNCAASDSTKKPCIDNRDLQWLTLGVRADVYRGVTVDLGADIRIRSPGFPYGPPLPPFNLMFGLSYPLDLDSLRRVVVVTRTVEKDGPWKTEGKVTGTVRNARDGAPVSGAVVAIAGQARARAASDPDGAFGTANVGAGPITLEVSAANFDPARVTATVVAGKSVDVPIVLVPNPAVAKVHGRVTDARGAGVEASIKFAGVEIHETKSDPHGVYAASVIPGTYQVKADVPGQSSRITQVDLVVDQDKQLDLVVRAATLNPNATLSGDHIKVSSAIRFVGATANPTAQTLTLVNAVADLLEAHGEIKHLRITAHWDNGLPQPLVDELTQLQADVIRKLLVGRGIADNRLTATGVGSTKPVVPNLSPANRARNRRVEFQVE
jgi:outer membrane protein OmpA-like peptidoglycan-associated protein